MRRLDRDERCEFFHLYYALLLQAGREFHIGDQLSQPEDLLMLPAPERMVFRELFLEHSELIDHFIVNNPYDFSEHELQQINEWKSAIYGRFYICEHRDGYSVFLSSDGEIKPYAVCQLTSNFFNTFCPQTPVMVEALLLPYHDTIVCDTLIKSYTTNASEALCNVLHDNFDDAAARYGLIDHFEFAS